MMQSRMEAVMIKSLLLVLLTATLAVAGIASAGEKGTREEARMLVEEAVAYLNAHGVQQTIAEIDKRDGMFVKGDLYVFAYDLDGVVVAHPIKPDLIGVKLLGKPDSTGKLFRDEIMALAKTQGSGWVDYTYEHPVTKEQTPKTTYIRRIGDLILCAGAYK
jgi:signal transduction histidine kinase